MIFETTYDYRTRRVSTSVIPAKAGGSSSVIPAKAGIHPVSTYFRYDSGDCFQELEGGSETINVEFIRGSGLGGGIGSILYSDRSMKDSGPVEIFVYNPAVGHVVATVNASTGSVVSSNLYEAYGNIVFSSGASDNNRLANTKERDASIGLDNHGFRYYDPEIGRYISRDPAGYPDGLNVYVYVRNNPVNGIDPLGLNEVIVSGGVHEDPNEQDTHDTNWKNFITAAEEEIKRRKGQLGEGEDLEWFVHESSYKNRAKNDGKEENEYIDEIKRIAEENGVTLNFYETKDDFIAFLNNDAEGKKDKDGNILTRQGDDKISRYTHYGHGIAGALRLTYGGAESLRMTDISSIKKEAFTKNAIVASWACNSGTGTLKEGEEYPNATGKSFSSAWKEHFGFSLKGAVGRIDYGPTASESTGQWVGGQYQTGIYIVFSMGLFEVDNPYIYLPPPPKDPILGSHNPIYTGGKKGLGSYWTE